LKIAKVEEKAYLLQHETKKTSPQKAKTFFKITQRDGDKACNTRNISIFDKKEIKMLQYNC